MWTDLGYFMSLFSLFTDDTEEKERRAVLDYWASLGENFEGTESHNRDHDVSHLLNNSTKPGHFDHMPFISSPRHVRVFTPEEEKAVKLIAKVIMRRIRFKRFVKSLREDKDKMEYDAAAKIQSIARMVVGEFLCMYLF